MTSAATRYGSGNVPSSFCTVGFASLNTAFIVFMLVDLVFQVCWIVINVVHTRVSELFWQVYMLFITWQYSSRLENYTSLKYGTTDPVRWSFYRSLSSLNRYISYQFSPIDIP